MNKAGLGKSQPVKIGKMCEYEQETMMNDLPIQLPWWGYVLAAIAVLGYLSALYLAGKHL